MCVFWVYMCFLGVCVFFKKSTLLLVFVGCMCNFWLYACLLGACACCVCWVHVQLLVICMCLFGVLMPQCVKL